MDPAGSGGRVGDNPRDARFEAFLEVASPPDLPPDIAAQIRAGLARQYDAPPVEQTALVLRSNCTVDRLRQMIYWPTEEDAELYPALIRSPPPGAPSTHPSARTQVTFLMATYLRHAKDRRFAEAFVLAGGLASLVPLLVHPNLHLRGQAMETFLQFTDEALFPWHDPPRAQSSTDKAMHQRMLELAKQALVPNLTANVVSRREKKETERMTRRRFRAARGWPCARSRSSPRTCGCGTAPGTSCGSALSCSPCCCPSRTTRRARAPPTRERWPRRCTTIFRDSKPI